VILAKKIIELLKNKNKIKKMALAGKRFVEFGYSLDIMLERIESLYHKLMMQKENK
jgi:glycosyltransferase involved in cell wall biosynthesis